MNSQLVEAIEFIVHYIHVGQTQISASVTMYHVYMKKMTQKPAILEVAQKSFEQSSPDDSCKGRFCC